MPAVAGSNHIQNSSCSPEAGMAATPANMASPRGASNLLPAKRNHSPTPYQQGPVPRTFGNIVRNLLFGPEDNITPANTVVVTYQDSLSGNETCNSALDCTLFKLRGAAAAILCSTSPAIRQSQIKLVFSNDLAVLALIEALKQHGVSPAVLETAAELAENIACEHLISRTVTDLHAQLAWALQDAAVAMQLTRSYAAAEVKGEVAAVAKAAAVAANSAAVLAAAAPPELLLRHLDPVEQTVITAGASAGCSAAAGSCTTTWRTAHNSLVSHAVQLLAKSCGMADVPRPEAVQAVPLASSRPLASGSEYLAGWPVKSYRFVRLWETLSSWKCLQVLTVGLVYGDFFTRDLAETVLLDMVHMTRCGAFADRLDVAQLATEVIAALNRACSTFCDREDTEGAANNRGISDPYVTPRTAALGLLLSLLLNVCTASDTDAAELLAAQLLQLEQQRVHTVEPQRLRVVVVLNKALRVILQAQDAAAAVTACGLISHLVSAAEALRKQPAYTHKPTASISQQWSTYSRSSDRYQLQQTPKLLERHFPQLKAAARLVKQVGAKHNKPSHLANLAACLCYGVLPEALEDWEDRMATAVVQQPRHGMNSSAVFEREQGYTAGLFSSRRLRKLVKVKNRGFVV